MKIECPHCGQNIDLGDDPPSSISCPACNGRIEIKIQAKVMPLQVPPGPKQVVSPILSPGVTESVQSKKSDGNFVIRSRVDRWTVNFGSKSTKNGSLGFRLTGQAVVADDGKLLLDGWRLWPIGGRIALGVLLAIVLWFPLKEVGWWLAEQFDMLRYTGRRYMMTIKREDNQLMGFFLILPSAAMISGIISGWIATRWMIHKESARFTPLTRPTNRGTSATLEVDSQDGGLPQKCTLRFQSLQDTQAFSSRFVE